MTTEILILDDEADVAREIADGLRDEGYLCTVVHRAVEALALVAAAKDRFAVIVSDIRMPDMDGLALAHRLLAIHGAKPRGILLITGHAVPAEIATSFPPGAVHVVRKPFRWEEFIAAIIATQGKAGPSDNV